MTKKTANESAVIADYNGYDYKKIFWEDADREYEDLADRMAIRRLLPKTIQKFVDIAGGYGRLADEYLLRFLTIPRPSSLRLRSSMATASRPNPAIFTIYLSRTIALMPS